jgi:hypothetical protein
MKEIKSHLSTLIAVLLAMGLASTGAQAQDDAKAAMKADKTGTNPINFQRDIRVYNEFTWLNTAGDGEQNVTTLEYRQPFADGKWQFRGRTRMSSIEADLNDNGMDDIDDSGWGDSDIRFLTVPYFKGANAFATAFEVFFDTATHDSLGSGATSFGPQLFYARFFRKSHLPIYSGGGLFAPGLQYKFSVEEDDGRADVNQILIDLNYLAMAKDGQSWFFTDPQIVIDRETKKEFAILDFEFGWMMTKWFPEMTGQSFYIRPSVSVGKDRPSDFSIEVAYKIIGW